MKQRLVARLLETIFSAVVMTVLSWVVMRLASSRLAGHVTFLPKLRTPTLDSYEQQINDHIVDPSVITEKFDDIGGLTDVKAEVKTNVLLPLKYPHIFFSSDPSLHPTRGILLHGPPGTGKTMIGRSIAAECNVPFVALSLAVLENKWFGETSRLLRACFSLARKIQPCVLFFDEIDGLMRSRNEQDQSCVYGLKTEMLNNMDGLTSKSSDAVIVIGCTNSIATLDPALKRRLPKQYYVGLPDHKERRQILRLKMCDDSMSDLEIDMLARVTKNASGSDLAEICRRASALRLHEHCQSTDFVQSLASATDSSEVSQRLKTVRLSHYMKAIQLVMPTAEALELDTDEEAPPPP